LLKLVFIRTAAYHEFCESFSRVQFDKESCLDGLGDIYFAEAELFSQFLTMCLGGDYDCSVPGFKGGTDMPSQGFNQCGVMLIELYSVPAGMLYRIDLDFSGAAVSHNFGCFLKGTGPDKGTGWTHTTPYK